MCNDFVECPYCGKENDMTNALCDGISNDNTLDWECDCCGEEFEIYVEFNPTYSASKIEYKKCIDCREEYRVDSKSYPKPSKYKNVISEDYYVCDSCFAREYIKDLENK